MIRGRRAPNWMANGGIDRRCDGVWGCRKNVHELRLVIGLVHGSKVGDTEVGSKVGKIIINRDHDTDTTLHPFLEVLTTKYSGLRCNH